MACAGGYKQPAHGKVNTVKKDSIRKPDYPDAKEGNEDLVKKVRDKIVARGARGINGIKRAFKIIDDDDSKSLSHDEFFKALRDYRITKDPDEQDAIFRAFDRDGNGEINYDEFLYQIIGPMNHTRKSIVTQAYKKMDANKDGVLTV
jgi:hypothetical protein